MSSNPIETDIRLHSTRPAYWAFAMAALAWTLLTGYSLHWNLGSLHQAQLDLATKEARGLWNKDAAFRQWATMHGGVYVEPDPRTPPNPYLSHLPNRDVVTRDGMQLTLMNPAYMMRQMAEEFSDSYGIKGSITGKIQLNPINRPDSWEAGVLERFEQGEVDEYVEQADIDGAAYIRYMKPMYMTEGCVKCHGILGFKDGDLRGGVSVSVPLAPYLQGIDGTLKNMRITHGVVWFIGMVLILGLAILARFRYRDRLHLIDRLRHDALFDRLTGLPNRHLLLERLSQAIVCAQQRGNLGFVVCFIDLDRFKQVNDSYGHSAGDQVLQEIAQRLSRAIRPSDTVARISGDEFVCLLGGADAASRCTLVAQRIRDDISQPMQIGHLHITLDCSIGLCLYDAQYDSAETMIRDADTAMYRAKKLGRGQVEVFNPQMHQSVMQLTTLEHGIRAALPNRELSVVYQPVVDAQAGTIAGFEALLRWRHSTLGPIPPDRFIPIAEETGAIHAIGEWVLQQACGQLSRWNRQYGRDRFFISVNLSALQVMQGETDRIVARILEDNELTADRLHCEITETALLSDVEASRPMLERLSGMGIHLSADDFGKGYCSLTYLQDFEFDVLKIDKQFVQDMQQGGKGLKLVKTLLLLAQDLGMVVVAEGIETDDQLQRLRALHCRFMQGYLLCPPLPASDIEEILEQGGHNELTQLRALNPFTNHNAAGAQPAPRPDSAQQGID